MVRGFGSLDPRRGSLERDLDLVILGVWWSEFDWQLFTFFRRDRSDALRLGSHGDGRMGQIIKWTTNYFF
jgi:hypothetical protein